MPTNKILTRILLGGFVGLFLAFIGLYPQIWLRQLRGENYQGIYAFNDLDEAAYAAYLQSQIDNRPRRSNPFTGVDDAPGAPLPESLFSIQFFTPQLVAAAARVFGTDSSTALIFASAIAAAGAALAMFWLILALTKDEFFAAAATLITLCGGVFIIGEGAFAEIYMNWAAYPYFPFLRRYIPAVPFPFFWIFGAATWKMLIVENNSKRAAYLSLAIFSFFFLVYSYFYLWTAAAAWLACVWLVWLAFRPAEWRRQTIWLAILSGSALVILIPYAVLLSNRDTTMDSVQLLVLSRQPDLLRAPEILSFVTLAILCFAVWRGFVTAKDHLALFVATFALVPFVVFNQQILTGRSLQPIHYQVFIINYVSLFAFAMSLYLLWRGRGENLSKFSRSWLPVLTIIACAWGIVEAHYTTAVSNDANVARDAAKPVGDRLRELANNGELFDENGDRRVVLAFDLLQGNDLPTLAPQAVLWARHQHVFAGESTAENRERFYHFLYFSGIDENSLEQQLREGNVILIITLFGWDKLSNRLSSAAKPVTFDEITAEKNRFAAFRRDFNPLQNSRWRISYVVVDADAAFDYAPLERWYERDTGEQIGKYRLYRLTLRQTENQSNK